MLYNAMDSLIETKLSELRRKRKTLSVSFEINKGPNDIMYKNMWYINPNYISPDMARENRKDK